MIDAAPAGPGVPEPALCCRGLVKRFGDVLAVDGVDLEVRRGECFGLLGPNGAGKTTTIEILEGLLDPDAGEVRVLGRRWDEDAHDLRHRLGIQLQETLLAEKLTVAETIRLFRSFYREGPPVDEVLRLVALEGKRDAWVGKLSGGQKQRLAVACALVGAPELLFLDEPTTGLDPQSRRQLWALLDRYRAGGGTILLTTHYMDEAATLCDRLAIVDRGRVIALGTPRALVASLGAPHVIAFEVDETDRPSEGEPFGPPGQGGGGPGAILRQRPGHPEAPSRDAGAPASAAQLAPDDEPAWLAALPGVSGVRRDGPGWQLTTAEVHVSVPALLSALAARGRRPARLTTHGATLEDVFVQLTGRHFRDG
jgi:ABC-2 type transport system ATP-binding protein